MKWVQGGLGREQRAWLRGSHPSPPQMLEPSVTTFKQLRCGHSETPGAIPPVLGPLYPRPRSASPQWGRGGLRLSCGPPPRKQGSLQMEVGEGMVAAGGTWPVS